MKFFVKIKLPENNATAYRLSVNTFERLGIQCSSTVGSPNEIEDTAKHIIEHAFTELVQRELPLAEILEVFCFTTIPYDNEVGMLVEVNLFTLL